MTSFEGQLVLNMVDVATNVSSAKLIRKQCSGYIWDTIHIVQCLTNEGPVDHLEVEEDSAYVSEEMTSSLDASDTRMVEEMIENVGTVGIVERYHAPLCAS